MEGIFFLDVPRLPREENFCSKIAKLRPLVLLILVLLAEDKETGWNDNDMKQSKYLEKILCQYQFSHHKIYLDSPSIEPGPPK